MAQLISHGQGELNLQRAIAAALARIEVAGPEFGSQEQLHADLADWQDCELGRWMLVHGGWDAHWTRYAITYGCTGGAPKSDNEVEDFFLTQAPAIAATRERSGIFSQILSQVVQPGTVAMSVPCGLMDDLLCLPHAGDAGRLIGLDLDPIAVSSAVNNVEALALADRCVISQGDAWHPEQAEVAFGDQQSYRAAISGGVDVLTSNGLNIYEPDDSRIVALYRAFHAVLHPGGQLVVSALTPPEEWDFAGVDPDILVRSRGLLLINGVTWSNYRSTQLTVEQLMVAGFDVHGIHPGRHGVFPIMPTSGLCRCCW